MPKRNKGQILFLSDSRAFSLKAFNLKSSASVKAVEKANAMVIYCQTVYTNMIYDVHYILFVCSKKVRRTCIQDEAYKLERSRQKPNKSRAGAPGMDLSYMSSFFSI